MLKYLNRATGPALLVLAASAHGATSAAAAGDPAAGERVFNKCKACHTVGPDAKNRVGPHLNDVFGRTAGSLDGFKYSSEMVKAGEEGLVWTDETMDAFLAAPKKVVQKNRMAFAGLRKEADRADVIAFLAPYSVASGDAATAPADASEAPVQTASADSESAAAPATAIGDHGVFGLGRPALPDEIAAWDIDIRPDGKGLPEGSGTVLVGEEVYTDNCAVCHGDFGEGVDRWPVLAGGLDTLTEERPEKTIGSYWPYLSTVYDYVRRAMPFGAARSLSDDDVYAITAYILYLNDIVLDEDFELSKDNFLAHPLPNQANFIPDDRDQEPHYAGEGEPCMSDCTDGPVEITMRAAVLDVTPDADGDGAGAIE
ncbi:MAG: c-type cytochrome [Alphaproteobacteria bacterium]|nr:c-type cytochrome [Alphaproteobacteria bacterium]